MHNAKLKKLKEIKAKSIVRISHVLVPQLIASNKKNINSIEMHCKQCLDELYHIGPLLKTFSNKLKN